MESDESRPGSSASNSSDTTANSDNSRPSSPVPPKTPTSSHVSSSPCKSRSRTPTKSLSVSRSRSTSSSSENENQPENQETYRNNSSSRCSSESSLRQEQAVSRNQSISPPLAKSQASRSHTSSVSSRSSNGSHFNAIPNLQEADEETKDQVNIEHDDLSDVSDMETEKRERTKQQFGDEEITKYKTTLAIQKQPKEPEIQSENEEDNDNERGNNNDEDDDADITDLRLKLDQKKNQLKALENKEKNGDVMIVKSNGTLSEEIDDLVKKHDEDALDFEAEEGECQDESKEEEKIDKDITEKLKKSEGGVEEGEELEEGEVTDEEEKRPEETEPKPVCRFYTRGQCTWGMSCRFLHPGVTDKGNYTMFDMVRPVPVPHGGPSYGGHTYHDYRTDRPPLHHRPPVHHHPAYVAPHHDPRLLPPVVVQEPPVPMVESAWERGLRTAKEMMRKANKRKEQDMDFEDKKMNLSLSQDELEKDNYYIRDRLSPDVSPPYGRHPPQYDAGMYSPPAKFGRAPPMYDEDAYGRTARYRELPPHRMPQYEDDRRVRPAREVIVQRAEPVGRGDEWSDPWMRSKSPGRDRDRSDKRGRRDRRSYSSNSSYSSSSSSRTGSSSDSSRSPSPDVRRRRYNSTHSSHKSPPRRHIKTSLRSPSPRRRRSPTTTNEFKEHKGKKLNEIDGREEMIQMPPPTTIPAVIKYHKIFPLPNNPNNHNRGIRRSPVKKRVHISPSPISEKRVALSPAHKRKKISPPLTRKTSIDKTRKTRRGSSSSGSGSSDSSGSDSETSYSSSSDSSSRGNTPVKRPARPVEKPVIPERKVVKKVEMTKKRSPISIELRKPSIVGVSALTSEPTLSSTSSSTTSKNKTTRREELLKQLRAVEDAIARKRSKLN